MNKVSEESVLSLPERHARILALLQQNGSISVTQLAEQFRVSEVTIRKDLSYLEQQKKLYRTHGSAILLSPYISDRHVSEKEKRNVEEKQAIGKAAAALIEQNDSIIIASGTTMTFLAREIRPAGRLTVITASVPVTQILSQNEQTDVIQLGGITRSSSVSVVGPFAEQMLRSFNCSKLFIGVDGIDPDFGLTTTNMLEASLNRAMIDAAQKVVVLADSEGRRAGRQLEIRTPRLQQDLRSGGGRPHHHRLRYSGSLSRQAARTRHRGDRRQLLISAPLRSRAFLRSRRPSNPRCPFSLRQHPASALLWRPLSAVFFPLRLSLLSAPLSRGGSLLSAVLSPCVAFCFAGPHSAAALSAVRFR